ncbi:MAG TPA: hypothetical protein DCW60_03965, partial [Sutterella sp.]|nr:hypothetical protein [Sutterella sp.]
QSAKKTCRFLGLSEGQTALLCMPLRFIGAKMVMVRALLSGLEVVSVTPSSNPFKDLTACVNFAAMTPMQVFMTLKDATSAQRLKSVGKLIIGGSFISKELRREIERFPNPVWSTYGMTETLSHVALCPLNGLEASDRFKPLEGVRVSLSDRKTLIVDAPDIVDGPLQTNDIAQIFPDGSFTILGRLDNVINSGGIKMSPETIEGALEGLFDPPIAISAIEDARLGEMVVIVSEGPLPENWETVCRAALSKYSIPRRHFVTQKLPRTESGKLDRVALKMLAKRLSAENENP